jgi:predicted transcriptional regulator
LNVSLDSKFLQGWFGTARQRTPSLGERELAVLAVLWSDSPLTAQQVLDAMPDPDISLSTIQSTLERLHRKNVLSRQKQGRAFLYAPLMDRHALISSLLRDIADDLAGGELAPMVSGFIDFLGDDGSRFASLLDGDRAGADAAGDDVADPEDEP